MEATKKIYGETFIELLLVIFRLSFFITAVGIIFWAIYSMVLFLTDGPTVHQAFPVFFRGQGEGILNVPNDIGAAKFRMYHALGYIVSDSVPKGFLALFSVIHVSGYIFWLLCFGLTIRILDAARLGRFFIVENAIRLRYIGLWGIAYFVLNKLMVVVSASYFSDKLAFSKVNFLSFDFFGWIGLNSLFGFLFLLVISEAFRIGAQLKEESDLTI